MTVVHFGNQKYVGLSSDTKPTGAATNAEFWETDTDNIYIHSGGGTWVLRTMDLQSDTLALRLYDVIVFKVSSTYYAKKSDGTLVSSSATAQTVIAAALAVGGVCYIASGTYDLASGFTGFNVGTNDKVLLSRDALIRVPQGYTGVLWNFPVLTTGCTIEGGIFWEQGTPSRLWTCFRLYGSNNGVYANIIRDCIVTDAGIGIKFLTDTTTGWINDNWFENIKMTTCNLFVDFDYSATWPATENTGFFNNKFSGIYCQSRTSGGTTHGFRNIRHARNIFIDCNVWDANGAQITANFHADSRDNIIIGGIMTNLNFTDASITNTNLVIDRWQGLRINLNKILMVDTLLKRHATNVMAVRNITDSGYGTLRADNLQTFSIGDQTGVAQISLSNPTISIFDAKNIAVGTTTGTKIGTATTQKIAFFNKTPIVQPAAIAAPGTDGTSLQTAVNAIRTALTNLGLTA